MKNIIDDEEEAGPSSKPPKPLLRVMVPKQTSFNAVYAKKHVIRNIQKGKRYQK